MNELLVWQKELGIMFQALLINTTYISQILLFWKFHLPYDQQRKTPVHQKYIIFVIPSFLASFQKSFPIEINK
jgi:hypothetical protein